MELINNRYRVLSILSNNSITASYKVKDILNNNHILQLDMIDSENIPKGFIDRYIKEYIELSKIRCSKIIKLYDFGIVKTLDSKIQNNKQYFFTKEYVETSNDINSYIKSLTVDKIIETFIDICKGVNYLHLKGFVHGHIYPDNICVRKKNHGIILKDLVSIDFESQLPWNQREQVADHQFPLEMEEAKKSVHSDIYSLGELLLYFFEIKEFGTANFGFSYNKLEVLKEKYIEVDKLEKIIKKMMNQYSNYRYDRIVFIINDINAVLGKDYKAHSINELERIYFNNRLVGREEQLKLILDNIEPLKNMELHKKVFKVHGEHGVGKTRFLREMEHILSFSDVNTISCYRDEHQLHREYSPVNKLIEVLMKLGGDKYDFSNDELGKFLFKDADNQVFALNITKKEELYFIKKIAGFIKEVIGNTPTLFIVDDMHLSGDSFMELINYIINDLKDLPVMFLISYSDEELMSHNAFYESLEKISKVYEVQEVKLENLTEDETSQIIKSILFMGHLPFTLAQRIYNETYGNPLLIEEVLKNLYAQKIMHIDKNGGRWVADINDMKSLPIPYNIFEAIGNQIKNLDSLNMDILKVIAVYRTPISFNCLLELLLADKENILERLKSMTRIGIIHRETFSKYNMYRLHNKLTYSLIYDMIPEEEKRHLHRLMGNYIENQYRDNFYDCVDELVYHFERSSNNAQVIKYLSDASEKKDTPIEKRIKYLHRLLDFMDEDSSKERLGVYMNIAQSCDTIGEYSKALEYYKKALEICEKIEDHRQYIDIINNISYINLIRNNTDETLKWLNKLEVYRDKIDYEEGYLKSEFILANIYFSRHENDMCFNICSTALLKCENRYSELEGKFLNLLGIIYKENNNTDESLRYFQRASEIFKNLSIDFLYASVQNNIGAIYFDHYQDIGRSIINFSTAREIAAANRIYKTQIIADCNLGECYFTLGDFEMSLKHYFDVLNTAQKHGIEGYIFRGYVNLAKIYFRQYKFDKAYNFFILSEREYNNNPFQRKNHIIEFHNLGAWLYFTLGDYDKADEYAKKALEVSRDGVYKNKSDSLFILELIRLQSDSAASGDRIFRNVVDLSRDYMPIYEMVRSLYVFSFYELLHSEVDYAKKIYNRTKIFRSKLKSTELDSMEKYITCMLNTGKRKLVYLKDALKTAQNSGNSYMEYKSNIGIGDHYLSKNQLYKAMKYYIDACEIIRKLVMQIPEEYRLRFMNSEDKLYPFRKLLIIKDKYNGVESSKAGILTDMNQMYSMLDYKDIQDILKNKEFLNAFYDEYRFSGSVDISSMRELPNHLDGEPSESLNLALNYICRKALATNGAIILFEDDSSLKVIASKSKNFDITSIRHLLEKVKMAQNSFMIYDTIFDNTGVELLPPSKRAVICMGILKARNKSNGGEKQPKCSINGYLYLESDNILHNIGYDIFNECIDLSSFINLLIENYKFKIIASLDKLTEVYTRKYLEEYLEYAITQSKRDSEVFSLIMLDVDKFKNINDKFGHQKGDEVLARICSIVKDSIGSKGICGRYGGEEFVIVLPDIDEEEAEITAESIRARVEEANIIGNNHPVTISLGVASFPACGETQHELIEKVDKALYAAKESGRNRVQSWNNELSNRVKRKDKLVGIISGDTMQDHRNVLAMVDVLELLKLDYSKEEKIFGLLGRIIETLEAQQGMLFLVEKGEIVNSYSRKKFKNTWEAAKNYNPNIVEGVLSSGQGYYRIDWEYIPEADIMTGAPDWQSVICVPLVKYGKITGILYLSSPMRVKEFDFSHYNFAASLGDIATAIL